MNQPVVPDEGSGPEFVNTEVDVSQNAQAEAEQVAQNEFGEMAPHALFGNPCSPVSKETEGNQQGAKEDDSPGFGRSRQHFRIGAELATYRD